jgi:acetylornithine deacetylase
VGSQGEVVEAYAGDPIVLRTLPGFETDVAAFFTDIPNFAPLGVQAVLYGPGDILRAHTDHEYLTAGEVAEAFDGYLRIFRELRGAGS